MKVPFKDLRFPFYPKFSVTFSGFIKQFKHPFSSIVFLRGHVARPMAWPLIATRDLVRGAFWHSLIISPFCRAAAAARMLALHPRNKRATSLQVVSFSRLQRSSESITSIKTSMKSQG
jgi:hypothetical protein